ncbi:hypothetical protein B0H11DRAFT_1720235 [Mycena galericulata]|nr:hypothetical protein B0H11DRAFT_1720235 [Mycena galericulata]
MFLTFKLFDKLYYFYLNRYVNCAAQFISAYTHELTGADLAWVNKKYHGHRVLPPNRFSLLKPRNCHICSTRDLGQPLAGCVFVFCVHAGVLIVSQGRSTR